VLRRIVGNRPPTGYSSPPSSPRQGQKSQALRAILCAMRSSPQTLISVLNRTFRVSGSGFLFLALPSGL
jgi:hypothetical protein